MREINKEEQELNRKRAEWAGFRKQETIRELPENKRHEANLGWIYPDRQWRRYEPDFPKSLDACFRWLVPKLSKDYAFVLFQDKSNEEEDWVCEIYPDACLFFLGYKAVADGKDKTPALALCLAIDKLIGGGYKARLKKGGKRCH